jgi:hypothetical protein
MPQPEIPLNSKRVTNPACHAVFGTWELLALILAECPPRSHSRIASVCKDWHRVSNKAKDVREAAALPSESVFWLYPMVPFYPGFKSVELHPELSRHFKAKEGSMMIVDMAPLLDQNLDLISRSFATRPPCKNFYLSVAWLPERGGEHVIRETVNREDGVRLRHLIDRASSLRKHAKKHYMISLYARIAGTDIRLWKSDERTTAHDPVLWSWSDQVLEGECTNSIANMRLEELADPTNGLATAPSPIGTSCDLACPTQ